MDDMILQKLKIVVERSVRPVRATMARKRRMREELLAHLVAIVEEEVGRLGDERAALEQAKLRFGDPRELIGQTQETVPWWTRIEWFFEKWPFEPGRPAWRLARDVGLLVFGGYVAVATLFLVPVLLIRERQGEIGTAVFAIFLLAVFTALFTFTCLLSLDRMSLAMWRWNSGRSRWRLVLYTLASIPVFPTLTFMLYWGLSLDSSMMASALRLACCAAFVFPVLLLVMARQIADERRDDEGWMSLEIEE
ncbi:MAG TPA: hypothetical protein DD670_06690 [Planctomycetaceae bacterium]|nr:hypothetical protein [Planctomycetaceae bacterium]